MKYKIHKEKRVYDGHFKVREAKLTHETFDGGEITVTRQCFERGDSVAVLLHETDTDRLLFTKQFRYPTLPHTDGWIVEIVAGSLEAGDTPEERVRTEVQEELGYTVGSLEHLSTFFVSPGGSSERILLYFAAVTSAAKTHSGGGAANETEDIALVARSVAETRSQLNAGSFTDAKTLIALQWFFKDR
ncbi:NUDIX hydrolase [Altibacter sp.]|uniref:NUDIX domain-containing protein n=1 Tax=Altibacter sp. TaxID=2024823 RepID=UPI000C8BC429|nr:NUDIX hydrolase [Altibacter sp.]MAP54064.1 ADP-ribose pyrophosphatase [Altibacter sp.]